jgi:hypothetical protein
MYASTLFDTHSQTRDPYECSQLSIYFSLYAITGVPTSAQYLLKYFWFCIYTVCLANQQNLLYQVCQDRFTLVARRRVQSNIVVSQHPTTLCHSPLKESELKITYYSCSMHFICGYYYTTIACNMQ